MTALACSDTFSIPFRRKNKAFGWIPYFVGDQANRALRIFSQPEFRAYIEWPLLLYGPTGTGKTELGSSILLDHVKSRSRSVLWTGTDFVRAYLSAVDTDSLKNLRIKMYQADGVLIDDIEALQQHPACQVELAHLIDQLVLRELPLVFTALTTPDQLVRLMPQLSSRLMQGLVLPVHPPGETARRKMVEHLCRAAGLLMTDDARDYLVLGLPVGLPRLKHMINQIATSIGESDERELDATDIQKLLDLVSQNSVVDLVDTVLSSVADHFDLPKKQLAGKSRKQTVANARSIAAYLLRNVLSLGYADIGQCLGGRDHSTIMYSHRKIQTILEDDPKHPLAVATMELENLIRNALIVS